MAQGSGSARPVLAVGLAVLCLLAIAQPTLGAVYNVNWTFRMGSLGRSFRAGDRLVFKYPRGAHNVVPVSAGAYRSCSSPRGARPLISGNDAITLRKGANFFICTFPGHCQGGMKIAVNAA